MEEQLRVLAGNEGANLIVRECEGGKVEAHFGTVGVKGPNRDLATMRLANALLDDRRYEARLIGALRGLRGLSLDQANPLAKEGDTD